ncbi:unnamed protein product [Prunus armeniaca]
MSLRLFGIQENIFDDGHCVPKLVQISLNAQCQGKLFRNNGPELFNESGCQRKRKFSHAVLDEVNTRELGDICLALSFPRYE